MTQKKYGRRLRTDFTIFIGGKIHPDAAAAFDTMSGSKDAVGTLPNYSRQQLLTYAILLLDAEVKRRKILPSDDLEARLDLLT